MTNGKKEHTIQVTSDTGHIHYWTGTLDYLIDNVFGYSIGSRPKTIRSLVNRLNSGKSYWSMRNFYRLVK